MNYVTYDASGALTGGYSQEVQPQHSANHIAVSAEVVASWPAYSANQDRSGVVLIGSGNPVPPTAEELREQFKVRRAAAVAAIVVTVDGLQFDGDETSQSRMARAIVAMDSAEVVATDWVLTDNSVASVTADQLRRALILAGTEQTRLWVAA